MQESVNRTVLIVGATGFLGRAIGEYLASHGMGLRIVSRDAQGLQGSLPFPAECINWDGVTLPDHALNGVSVVINLAGEPVGDRRWTTVHRKKIYDSRISSTRAVVQCIDRVRDKPELLIQASAIGYYGNSGENVVDEDSPASDFHFLADVCRDWEQTADKIQAPVRVVKMRIGVVLGHGGGALQSLSDIYSLGLGAQLGSGKQWVSWIHVDDVCRFIGHAITHAELKGAFNLVSPNPVTNAELHDLLHAIKGGWRANRVPAFALRAGMGSRASILLDSCRVAPKRTLASGFEFSHPLLSHALQGLFAGLEYPRDHLFVRRTWLPVDVATCWKFFADERNLEKMTPDWLHFHVFKKSTPRLASGTLITYKLKIHGLPARWVSRIEDWQENVQFVDRQMSGPYSLWHHRHVFTPSGSGTMMVDQIQFRVPWSLLGAAAFPLIKADLSRIFAYRSQAIWQALVGNGSKF